MAMRMKCPCGQVLAVPANSAGKRVRCPQCQALLQVPGTASVSPSAVRAPATTASRPSEVPQGNLAPIPAFQSAAVSKPAPAGNTKIIVGVIAALVLLCFLPIGGWVAWRIASPMLTTASDDVASNFEPLAELANESTANSGGASTVGKGKASSVAPAGLSMQGRNATETAMLETANQFVALAKANKHHAAVEMIDVKLFHSRLYSKNGSYEAIMNDIPAGKLLKNFGNYALDGAEVGGKRHWRVIGVSDFEGQPGVVLRYYVEPQSALGMLQKKALFERLVPLMQYDQFADAAEGVFATHEMEESLHDRRSLGSHAIGNAFPPRAGYMMLVMDCTDATPRLIDLVNVMGNAPLSRTGAFVFLEDYHVFGGFGDRETFGTRASTATRYGITPLVGGVTWSQGDKEAERRAKAQMEAEKLAITKSRPVRLAGVVELVQRGDPTLGKAVDAFRQDFPGDLGLEMALVFALMSGETPRVNAAQDALISAASRTLFDKYQDPFFLYVQGLSAQQNGRADEAEATFQRCKQLGFETTDIYQKRIEAAIDSADTTQLLAALSDVGSYWQRGGGPIDEKASQGFQAKWAAFEKSMDPEPSLAERMAESRGGRGPFGNRMRPGDSRNGASNGESPDAGMPRGGSPGSRGGLGGFPNSPGGRPGGPGAGPSGGRPVGGPPAMNGPTVTVKITSTQNFDGNALMKELASKLGVQGFRFSQSNNQATLTLSYAGTLQSVVDQIGFGKVSSIDESTKTVSVTIP